MGLLGDGQAALIAMMKAANGRTITYTRGATSWTFTAWPGATNYVRETKDGTSVTWMERDYLFATADFLAAGGQWPPMLGDRITDPNTIDPKTGQASVFELQPTANAPVWQYIDFDRTEARVHSKR